MSRMVLLFIFLSQTLLAQPSLIGIENPLPGENHPYNFEDTREVFISNKNPFVKRLIALNSGLTYVKNIVLEDKPLLSLHVVKFENKSYLLKDKYLGTRSMPLSRKLKSLVGLPHVVNVYFMDSVKYDNSGGFHFLQLMDFLPGNTLEEEINILKQSCPADLQSKLLNIVSDVHDSIIELATRNLYCGDEKSRNYVFDGNILKRIDIEADCSFLNGEEPKLELGWLTAAERVLDHCGKSKEAFDSIRKEAIIAKNYSDLNQIINKYK